MKFLSKKIVALVAGSLAILGSVGAQAATATTTFNSTATVETACLISATELAFGSFTPTDAATRVNTTSDIVVTCSNGLRYSVSIGFGANGGTEANRFMKNSAKVDKLAYNIYSDDNYIEVLSGYTMVGNGIAQTYQIFGSLLSNQFVAAGTYSDTLAVNITY